MKKKIEWLSILQGWSMLLVVIGHITLTNTFRDPQYPIAACVERIVYSFHMPLFMFISGFLFHWTKIRKKTRFSVVIREKLMRLGIPFLFFTIMAVLPKLLFAPLKNANIPQKANCLAAFLAHKKARRVIYPAGHLNC